MLSRKQKWRRVKYPIDIKLNYSQLDDIDYNPIIKENVNKHKLIENAMRLNKKYKELHPNHVKFNSVVSVILIPVLQDYKDAKLNTQIWYSRDDYFLFMNEYREDIRKGKYNSI